MSDTQLDHEITAIRDENVRLRHVVAMADAWRESLNLPQQDIGCAEFNEAFENYDAAREEVDDILPMARCNEPGCGEPNFVGGRCDEHFEEDEERRMAQRAGKRA